MLRKIGLALLAIVWATAGAAQDSDLRRLATGVDAEDWAAVGRLNLGDSGFCTGVLIEDDLVLTAAHCLFDKNSGARIAADAIEFLVGWRDGRASAYRTVRQAVIHPAYDRTRQDSTDQMRHDLALLRLDHPVRDGRTLPFATAARPKAGAALALVSYGAGRAEAPSLQDRCRFMGEKEGVLVTTCAVEFGSSGAPIFTMMRGKARIVSIVTAKAQVGGQAVSLGAALDTPLEELRAALQAAPRRNGTGAKFVRP